MKQHITSDQLAELTPEQREALREWWKPQEGDWAIDKGYLEHPDEACVLNKFRTTEVIKRDYLPLLSIGQCIEFLRDKDPKRLCEVMTSLFRGGYIFPGKNQTFVYNRCKPEELIDALWKAIKAVLSCSQSNVQARRTRL